MRLPRFLIAVSRPFRHALVKAIAPEIWAGSRPGDYVPRPTIECVKIELGGVPCVGVEIGVQAGINAESIMETLKVKKLYLVDPYQSYTERDKPHRLRRVDDAKRRAQVKMAKYGIRVQFVERESRDAVSLVPNDLDFIYIDGNHDYEHVREDIELYYPKLRVGGVLGGHDFRNNFPGVIRAVCEFTVAHNCQLRRELDDWWISKEAYSIASQSTR